MVPLPSPHRSQIGPEAARRRAFVRRLAVVAGALVIVLSGSVLPARQQQSARPSRAIVAGVVVDAQTGVGVPHALVRALLPGGERRCYSAPTGWFFFAGLPGGEFEFIAERDGYLPGAVGKWRPAGDSLRVRVYGEELHPAVRIEMFRPAAIDGYVTDEGGEPIPDIEIRALRREFVNGIPRIDTVGRDRTDDLGNFRLFDLVPGEYTVVAPAVQISVPLDAIDEIGQTGSVSANLQLVANANGEIGPQELLTATTARDPDLLSLTAAPVPTTDDELAVYRTQYYPGAERADGATWIELAPGEVLTNVYFQLVPRAAVRVRGTVTGPDGPIAGAMVRLVDAEERAPHVALPTALTLTDSRGRFVMPAVPAGSYTVIATGRLAKPSPVPQLVPREPAGAAFRGEIAMTVDTDPIDVEVPVDVAPSLVGSVVFATTQPDAAPDATSVGLRLIDRSGGARLQIPVADDGQFSVPALEPGEYLIDVQAPRGWRRSRITAGQSMISDGRLQFFAGGAPTTIVVTLTDRPASVSGAVRDRAGAAVSGAAVVIQPLPRHVSEVPDPRRVRSVRAGLDGIYSVEDIVPGEYLLTAVPETDMDRWQEPNRLATLRESGVRVVITDGERRYQDLRVVGR